MYFIFYVNYDDHGRSYKLANKILQNVLNKNGRN